MLGVESVPDGLASGLLAGVNPVSGLYAYLFGMVGGTLFTGTTFMAIQSTGAMAIIVADVDLGSRPASARATTAAGSSVTNSNGQGQDAGPQYVRRSRIPSGRPSGSRNVR